MLNATHLSVNGLGKIGFMREHMRMRADGPVDPVDHPSPSADEVDIVVEVFRMLADHTRVQLLWALRDGGELTVAELATRVGKAQPAVSQHLAKLRLARLVQGRRRGAHVFYRAENEHVIRLVTDAVFHTDHLGHDVPRHHRARSDPKD
jgi:DNA-binding transcriptional ArsR family regulator